MHWSKHPTETAQGTKGVVELVTAGAYDRLLIDASAELRSRAEFFPPGAYRAKTAQLPAPILPADSEQTLTSETYGGTLDSSLNISHPIFPMK